MPRPEPVEAEAPAWRQFIEERERAIREQDRESGAGDAPPEPAPAPWSETEPAPTFIEEPELVEPELVEPPPGPAEVGSWWPQEPEPAAQPAQAYDEAWALPDEELPPVGGPEPDESAFPPPPPTPVPEPEAAGAPDVVAPPPPAERREWGGENELFQAPPEPATDDVLQQAPEAPLPELDPEEQAERRRQQEEAARAYERAREEE
jgi:hypothetical protein